MILVDHSLKISKATSLTDFLFLRQLRNDVRQKLTNLTKHLSVWDQVKFYLNRPPNIEIYIASVDGQRFAYLLLCDKGDSCFVTEAVVENYRKKGLALALINFAKTLRPVLIADILDTNFASRKLHEKAGFIEISQYNNIVRYQYNGNM